MRFDEHTVIPWGWKDRTGCGCPERTASKFKIPYGYELIESWVIILEGGHDVTCGFMVTKGDQFAYSLYLL